jgi:hypothetical protein
VFATSPTLVTPALGTPASGVVTNLTGTASININGTVGATTASTGAFTTLSASGDVTLSGGTANGVAFANGSKVLTTGSALTFDGTNLGVGIGGAGTAPIDVASNGSAIGLMLRGRSADSIGTLQFQSNDGATVRAQIQSRGDELRFLSAGNVPQTYYVNAAEQMRLTSTGLGIGTSSPSATYGRLTVAGTGITIADDGSAKLQIGRYSAGLPISFIKMGANSTGLRFTNPTDSVDLMAITDAGNVGIGTSSPALALSVNKTSDTTFTNLPANILSYDTTAMAAGVGGGLWFGGKFNSGNDSQTVFAAISGVKENGTSGNTAGTLVFGVRDSGGGVSIERMRLDSSGNLGLGVTPSAWNSGYKAFVAGGTNGNDQVGGIASGSGITIVSTNYFRSSTPAEVYGGTGFAMKYVQSSGAHEWYTAPSGTAGDAISFTQAMSLDASGNLFLGTTAGSGRFNLQCAANASYQLAGNFTNGSDADFQIRIKTSETAIGPSTATPLVFSNTSGTERARITSGGDLLVGTTSQLRAGDKLSVLGIGTQVATFNQDTNTSGYSAIATIIGSNGNNTDTYHFWGNTSGVGNWYLYGNGTTSYSSDARLKKNIATTRDGYLDDVLKLRVVKYNWLKDDDSTPKELGLIAQEVEQVFPGLVQDDLNPVEDGGMIYKQVKQSVLPFMLLKAIQELKAEFDAYKATHP